MSRKRNYCPDCAKEIKRGSKRCRSCATKAAWSRGDLGGPVHRRNLSKSGKTRWRNPEARRKQSAALKAAWRDLEYRKRRIEISWDPDLRHVHSEAIKAAHKRGVYACPEVLHKKSVAMQAAHARGDFQNQSERIKLTYQDPRSRRKKSEASKMMWQNPGHRLRMSRATKATWQNPEIRHKRSAGIQAAHARGDYDGNSGAMKAAWVRGVYDGVFQSPTSIELAVIAALDARGIEHKSQHRFDNCRFTYDEFVLPNILIETHGDYWHGPENPENEKRDAEKAAWAKENGYHLVVMWEHEIKEQGAEALVRERVLPMLSN